MDFRAIGEALRNVPADVQTPISHIPWSDVPRMRHVLVHDHDKVDGTVVWTTIRDDLPPLVEPLTRLFQRSEK
jgi:uncharacterized protein with HEPN domain